MTQQYLAYPKSLLARTPPPNNSSETLRIAKGALGPLEEGTELQIRPLTVFIGKQGTGKSLAAQVLYFFRDLPFLVSYDDAVERRDLSVSQDSGAESVVRGILDGLRSSQRTFATFASPNATLEWTGELLGVERTLAVTLQNGNRRARPRKDLELAVKEIRSLRERPTRGGLFVPTERLLYSQAPDVAFRVFGLPLTLTIFAQWIDETSRVIESWAGGDPDTAEGKWIRERGRSALAGEAYRHRGQWKWRADTRAGKQTQFDMDMASSGQRANWPLVFIPQALFSLRSSLSPNMTLYVEEPEIHLHPSAQRVMVQILAYLVNHGFRIVVTTHSLTILYALNNLCMAAYKLGDQVAAGVPDPEIRLDPRRLAAYMFDGAGARPIVNPETGFIAEDELGQVTDELMVEMNQIGAAAAAAATPKE